MHQGENKLDKDAWEEVKKNESVAKLLESKSVEELGEVKEVAKPAAKPVADAAPVAEEPVVEESHDEDEE